MKGTPSLQTRCHIHILYDNDFWCHPVYWCRMVVNIPPHLLGSHCIWSGSDSQIEYDLHALLFVTKLRLNHHHQVQIFWRDVSSCHGPELIGNWGVEALMLSWAAIHWLFTLIRRKGQAANDPETIWWWTEASPIATRKLLKGNCNELNFICNCTIQGGPMEEQRILGRLIWWPDMYKSSWYNCKDKFSWEQVRMCSFSLQIQAESQMYIVYRQSCSWCAYTKVNFHVRSDTCMHAYVCARSAACILRPAAKGKCFQHQQLFERHQTPPPANWNRSSHRKRNVSV